MPCSPASILPPPGTLHIDEKLRRDLPDGSARVKIPAHRAPTRSTGGVQSPVRTGNLWSVESSTTSRNHLRCRTWRRARVRAVNLRPTHVAGPASTRGSLVEVETAPPSKLIRIRVLAVRELVQIDPVRQVCDFGRVYAGESVTKHGSSVLDTSSGATVDGFEAFKSRVMG